MHTCAHTHKQPDALGHQHTYSVYTQTDTDRQTHTCLDTSICASLHLQGPLCFERNLLSLLLSSWFQSFWPPASSDHAARAVKQKQTTCERTGTKKMCVKIDSVLLQISKKSHILSPLFSKGSFSTFAPSSFLSKRPQLTRSLTHKHSTKLSFPQRILSPFGDAEFRTAQAMQCRVPWHLIFARDQCWFPQNTTMTTTHCVSTLQTIFTDMQGKISAYLWNFAWVLGSVLDRGATIGTHFHNSTELVPCIITIQLIIIYYQSLKVSQKIACVFTRFVCSTVDTCCTTFQPHQTQTHRYTHSHTRQAPAPAHTHTCCLSHDTCRLGMRVNSWRKAQNTQ